MAKSLRKKFYYQNLESLNVNFFQWMYLIFCFKIEDLNMFPKAEIHPIIFDEVYILDKNPAQLPEKNENIVFIYD